MICDFDRIDALAEGTLSPEEEASVREHMNTCRSCRIYYLALTDAAGSEHPPAHLGATIMQRVRSDAQAQRRRSAYKIWRSIAASAACAVLVLGIGWAVNGLVRRGSTDEAADMVRNYESQDPAVAGEDDSSGSDLAQYGQDLPLKIHTVTDPALCAQIRAQLADWGVPELYPDGSREAYDLTLAQVRALNTAVPGAELPEQMLQLELKNAE